MINIAIGIFLLDCGRSQAFNIFIIVSFVGTLMYITLHVTYNVLPKIRKKRQGGMYMHVLYVHVLWYDICTVCFLEADEVLMLTKEKSDNTKETIVVSFLMELFTQK